MSDKPPITRQMSSQSSLLRKPSRVVSRQSSQSRLSLEFTSLDIGVPDVETTDAKPSMKRKRSMKNDDTPTYSVDVISLIVKRKDGVIFSPPSCIYCFNPDNEEQKKSVLKKIENEKELIENVAEYAKVNIFTAVCKSFIPPPSVLGGINRGYLSVKKKEKVKKEIKKAVKVSKDKDEDNGGTSDRDEVMPQKKARKL